MTDRWVVSDHVVSSPLGDELALLDTQTNRYFTLNSTAATVWESVTEAASSDSVSIALARKFNIAVKDCVGDVEEILAQLASEDLIRPAEDGEA